MSKYHPSTLRTMALQVIAAWQRRDPLYDEFMLRLQQRTGLKRGTCERILTGLAGY